MKLRFAVVALFLVASSSCSGSKDDGVPTSPTAEVLFTINECCHDNLFTALTNRYVTTRNKVFELNAITLVTNAGTLVVTDVTPQVAWVNTTPTLLSLDSGTIPCTLRPSRRCKVVRILNVLGDGRVDGTWQGHLGDVRFNIAG